MPRDRIGTVDGLAQLSFLIQATLERHAAAHNLSMPQVRLLGVLRDRVPSMNELATLLGLDKSSVTGLVDRAERRGLVARTRSTSDRRGVVVTISAEGASLVTQAAADFGRDITAMLAGLSAPERATLTALVGKVLVARSAEQGFDLFPMGAARPRA